LTADRFSSFPYQKRAPYRHQRSTLPTELLYDVGHKEMKRQLKWLADLQDAIGVWHDRQVLHQAVAEAVARADILLNELPTARILLAELETDRSRESQDVEKIFHLATEHPSHRKMESGARIPSRLIPYPLPLR
jgi:CHAD domain-containing protein